MLINWRTRLGHPSKLNWVNGIQQAERRKVKNRKININKFSSCEKKKYTEKIYDDLCRNWTDSKGNQAAGQPGSQAGKQPSCWNYILRTKSTDDWLKYLNPWLYSNCMNVYAPCTHCELVASFFVKEESLKTVAKLWYSSACSVHVQLKLQSGAWLMFVKCVFLLVVVVTQFRKIIINALNEGERERETEKSWTIITTKRRQQQSNIETTPQEWLNGQQQ